MKKGKKAEFEFMIKISKYIFALLLVTLSLFYHQQAFGFFDFESPQKKQWKKDVTEMIQSTFDQILPENERKNWKGLDGEKFSVRESSGSQCWIPVGESKDRFRECLTIVLSNKPNKKEERQYKDIDEAFIACKRNYAFTNSNWKLEKINDKEAIIDHDTDNGTIKSIERKILLGNWLISFEYEYFPSHDKAKELDWNQKRNLWLERFLKVHFE
jgi:hypothetical protein